MRFTHAVLCFVPIVSSVVEDERGFVHDWNVANSHNRALHVPCHAMPCQSRARQNIFCFDRVWHVPAMVSVNVSI